jgi:hypothetical protein
MYSLSDFFLYEEYRMAKPIIGLFIYYIIMFFFTSLLISAIFMLLKTITCGSAGTFAFEHFEDDKEKTMRDLAKKLRSKLEKFQDELDTLNDDNKNSLCETFDFVKTNYIGNRILPSDDESSLTPEVQTKRKEKREARAEKSFKERLVKHEKERGKIIECFEVSPAQEDLEDAIKEVNELGLPYFGSGKFSDEMKAKFDEMTKTVNLYVFNEKYLEKTLTAINKAVESANNEDAEPSKETTEGFETIKKPEEVIGIANYYISMFDMLSNMFADFKKKIKEQKSKIGTINTASTKIVGGDSFTKGGSNSMF